MRDKPGGGMGAKGVNREGIHGNNGKEAEWDEAGRVENFLLLMS